MKVLIVVTTYDPFFPRIETLEEELAREGIFCDVLEIDALRFKSGGHFASFAPPFWARLVRVRKLGTVIRMQFVRRFIRRLMGRYQAVNIHSCDHIYYHLIDSIASISDNLSVMIWGSDFYRISDHMRQQHRKIFDRARFIALANPKTASDFEDYYRSYKVKLVQAGFGVRQFDKIRDLKAKWGPKEARRHLQLPPEKILISCGYNGREGQQHLLLLDQINSLPPAYRHRICLVLQMGYLSDAKYQATVFEKLRSINIDYSVIERPLSEDEISWLRVVPDITLNAQVTDSFSASVQEHLYAGNILIAGDWLPYGFLQEKGVFFKQCAAEGFAEAIIDVMDNLELYRSKTQANWKILDLISGWPVRARQWAKLYRGEVMELLWFSPDPTRYQRHK